MMTPSSLFSLPFNFRMSTWNLQSADLEEIIFLQNFLLAVKKGWQIKFVLNRNDSSFLSQTLNRRIIFELLELPLPFVQIRSN